MTTEQIILAVTPKDLFCIHINKVVNNRHKGRADFTLRGYEITTTHPLKSFLGLIIFMHECAHVHLGHCRADITVGRSYVNEIGAWSQVKFWLAEYNVAYSKSWLHGKITLSLKNHVIKYGIEFSS